MLDGSPSFHFAGTFGHEGSGSKDGRLAAAAAALKVALRISACRTFRFMVRTFRAFGASASHCTSFGRRFLADFRGRLQCGPGLEYLENGVTQCSKTTN